MAKFVWSEKDQRAYPAGFAPPVEPEDTPELEALKAEAAALGMRVAHNVSAARLAENIAAHKAANGIT